MILTCPNCGTQYVVKDGAIPPEGRQVRCASCKHSWHQDAEPAAPPDVGESDEGETIAEATLIEPRTGPQAEERAYEEAMVESGAADEPRSEQAVAPPATADEQQARAPELSPEPEAQAAASGIGGIGAAEMPALAADWNAPPSAAATDDEFSPFPAPDGVAPQGRNPILTVVIVVLAVTVLAALFYFLAPAGLKGRLGLGTGTASQLALIVTHRDRQQLESGNQLLTVTGRVINPTGKLQDVPPLQAQLRSKTGKIVYSWTIAPPARTLAAGASAPFNSAEVNVPPGADELTITLGEAVG